MLPTLNAQRTRFPWIPLLVVILPLATAGGTLKFLQVRSLRPIKAELTKVRNSALAAESETVRLSAEVTRLSRELKALEGISKVDIVWGGAGESTSRIAFPYQKNGSVWVHPRTGSATVWYYTDEGDTLKKIAAHPRVLGAAHLWPLLAKENGLQADDGTPLPAGRLLRVPDRVYEYQLRHALTVAGTPDKQRNEILAQAGLKP